MSQIMAPAKMLKVGETPSVSSSTDKETWKGAAKAPNKADIIAVVMSPSYVDELRNGRNGGYWRFTSADRIEELLALGKPDQNGNLHFKIIREGEGRGIYFISENEWLKTKAEDGLRLHEPSIRDAIKEKRPLAVDGYGYYGLRNGRLNVNGNYNGNNAARVAQLEAAREASAPRIEGLLRAGKGQTVVLRSSYGKEIKITADEDFEITVK